MVLEGTEGQQPGASEWAGGPAADRRCRSAFEGTSYHRDVFVTVALSHNLLPLSSKRGENGKALRLGLLERQADVLESERQGEAAGIIIS